MNLRKWLIAISISIISLLFITPTSALEAFVIDNMFVELNVEENGVIHVEQILNVEFSEPRHGLYFNILTKYKMDWNIEGNTVSKNYHFPVTNIKVYDHDYEIDKQSNGVQVRLGSEDIKVSGQQKYRITYDIETKDLKLGGKQVLYQNLINNWDTYVNKADIIIKMPKSFDLESVYFHVGDYGANSSSYQGFTYKIEDNTIHATLSEALEPNQAIMLWLDVPNGYFSFPKPFDFTILIVLGSIALIIGVIAIFFLYGKDGLVIKTIMFSAPEGLTCAAISYVVDGVVRQKDIICLLIEWAGAGYLKIEEMEGKEIRLIKVMDMDKERAKYERRLFQAIFKNKDEVLTSELSDKFYHNIDKCAADVKGYFRDSKERRIFSKNSLVFKIISLVIAILPIFVGILFCGYPIYYEFSFALLLAIIIAIFGFGIIMFWYLIVLNHFTNKRMVSLLLSIGNAILSIILIGAYYYVVYFGNQNYLVFAFTTLASVIIVGCAIFMDKRTDHGMKLFGEILGLKEFIETAEKDRLQALVNDNPQYFYNILPYAYVLGVCDVWSKKFTDIVMDNASWYVSNENVPVYLFMPRFYRSISTLQTSLYHIPEIQAGTGGGNFTGGGGGGFSGGGFGGGGGGSW